MHSLGVHLSHNQNPHFRQHLQQQQEQQNNIIINTMVTTTLPQVEVNILKPSNLLAFSLLINSSTSLILTPAIFSSSTEDNMLSSGFFKGSSCNLSRSKSVKQQSKSTDARGKMSSRELFCVMVDKAYKVLCVE
jgi:hypothetical protein